MLGANIPHCFSMHNRIMWKGVGGHKGKTNKSMTKLSLVFHILCFVFYFYVSCFIFMFCVLFSFQKMKPNNGGGWGQCSSSFLFVPPCTNITTRKGTWPIHKKVKRRKKQGERRKGCSLLTWKNEDEDWRWRGLTFLAAPFCTIEQHEREHKCNIRRHKGQGTKPIMKNRNKDHLIGRGEMFFPFFFAQTQ